MTSGAIARARVAQPTMQISQMLKRHNPFSLVKLPFIGPDDYNGLSTASVRPEAATTDEAFIVKTPSLVRTKGLFSFYKYGHQECYGVRKVRPLRRSLKGFRAWIMGQRKDQFPGTQAYILVVQVDPSFKCVDGGICSLIKSNPGANVEGKYIWNFLRTMDVPVKSLYSKHDREGWWWWEDAKAKECGLHKGNITNNIGADVDGAPSVIVVNGVGDIFKTPAIINLSRPGIENLMKLENRSEPWEWKLRILNWLRNMLVQAQR